jgi:hypothetical protein
MGPTTQEAGTQVPARRTEGRKYLDPREHLLRP